MIIGDKPPEPPTLVEFATMSNVLSKSIRTLELPGFDFVA